MSDYQQELIENFNKYRIGLDDTFAFRCRSCGKCCRNREDILLNSRDVYNIAAALNLTHRQVIEAYCDTYIGANSRIPVVRLQPRGANRVCPLLKGDRCAVHSLKPTVCALYPLGRIIATGNAPEKLRLDRPGEIEFILNPPPCGSRRHKQTVRAWLEAFGIPVDDRFFVKWNETIYALTADIQRYEGKPGVTEGAMEMMWGGIFAALYADYDTGMAFYPQFEHNAGKILGIFETLKQLKI